MSASTFAVSSPDGTDAVAALAGASPAPASVPALQMRGLVKAFDRKVAVDRLSLDIPVSSFYGIVGPNGAGKTTSLSMATGLLRPDAGQVLVHGVDVWTQPQRAKTLLGVPPDGLRAFQPLVARTRTVHRAVGPVAYDCVKVVVIRSGTAVLFSEFGQKPIRPGDVLLLAPNTL